MNGCAIGRKDVVRRELQEQSVNHSLVFIALVKPSTQHGDHSHKAKRSPPHRRSHASPPLVVHESRIF